MAAEDPTYADKLRQALERDGWSQARLVRDLAIQTGNAVESERSAVRGYMHGSVPRPERAKLIAEITGVPELAEAEHPRLSGSARLEHRLEALAEAADEIQANQHKGLLFQEQLLAELQAIREALGISGSGGQVAPKRSQPEP